MTVQSTSTLKDKNTDSGLYGYASAAREDDPEYADEIEEMAARSGANHPNCKKPD